MTDKLTEEVARAICCTEDHEICNEDIGAERDKILMPCSWPLYREQARAAIRATLEGLMEPTAGMVKAGVMAMSATMSHGEPESAVIYGQPKDVLQAMLRTKIAELDSE